MFNNCTICGRTLKSAQSKERGMGPVCAAKNGGKSIIKSNPDTGDLYDLPFDGNITCRRDGDNGPKHFNFPQAVVRHSPTGMEWGYGGSGPADFAINALLAVTGKQMCARVYQAFKFQFVATLPKAGGTISGEAIRAWLAEQPTPHEAPSDIL